MDRRSSFSLLALLVLAGCSNAGGPSGSDAGATSGTDGGGSSGTDAGPLGDRATWTVSGARSGSYMHDDDLNYVSCVLTGPGGLLDLTAAYSAGLDPRINIRLDPYTGPGTYDLVYAPGGRSGGSAEVGMSGGYRYWYFYDYSTTDFVDVPSTCTVTVEETIPNARVEATVACSRLVSVITSPDYDDRDALGYRPYVSATASFACDI